MRCRIEVWQLATGVLLPWCCMAGLLYGCSRLVAGPLQQPAFAVSVYFGALGMAQALALAYARRFTRLRPRGLLLVSYRWIAFWHGCVFMITVCGALLGAILFTVIGSLAGMDYPFLQMLRRGALDGGFYALIWAPGLSFVLCAVRAHRAKRVNGSDA